jgi:hypothetical protein
LLHAKAAEDAAPAADMVNAEVSHG